MTETITDLFGNDDTEAMYQQALRVPLTDKIDMAIMLIKEFERQALALSPDGYYVCFSGGKDSLCLQKLHELSGTKYELHNSHTTLDAPELTQYLRQYWPNVITHKQETSLLRYMVDHGKGMPVRNGRWCCEVFKEQGGNGRIKSMGVRADESARRKGLWQQVKIDNRTKLPVLAPILYWTEKDVWDFIKQYQIPYPKLYDQGFSRLGCIGCPQTSRKKRMAEFRRWPKYEQMWKRACQRMWEQWVNVPRKRDGKARTGLTKFKTWEDYWEWWMENSAHGDRPDCQMFQW